MRDLTNQSLYDKLDTFGENVSEGNFVQHTVQVFGVMRSRNNHAPCAYRYACGFDECRPDSCPTYTPHGRNRIDGVRYDNEKQEDI